MEGLMQITLAGFGVLIGICSSVLAGFVWLSSLIIKAITKPMQVSLDNNTEAMNKSSVIMNKLDARLDGHEVRITKIETVQHIRGCGDKS